VADWVDFSIDLPALLQWLLEFPQVRLNKPVVMFEIAKDGRKSWLLDVQQRDESAQVAIGQLTLDHGQLGIDDSRQDTHIRMNLDTPDARRPQWHGGVPGQRLLQRFASGGQRAGRIGSGFARGAHTLPFDCGCYCGGHQPASRGRRDRIAELERGGFASCAARQQSGAVVSAIGRGVAPHECLSTFRRPKMPWSKFQRIAERFMPTTRNAHPYPEARFYASYT
jgi:hypothetical protein